MQRKQIKLLSRLGWQVSNALSAHCLLWPGTLHAHTRYSCPEWTPWRGLTDRESLVAHLVQGLMAVYLQLRLPVRRRCSFVCFDYILKASRDRGRWAHASQACLTAVGNGREQATETTLRHVLRRLGAHTHTHTHSPFMRGWEVFKETEQEKDGGPDRADCWIGKLKTASNTAPLHTSSGHCCSPGYFIIYMHYRPSCSTIAKFPGPCRHYALY